MFADLTQKEGKILLWIQDNIRNDLLTPIVKGITYLGEAGWFWILLCVVFMAWKKYRPIGLTCSASLAISFVINFILKLIVARTRPYEAIEGLTRLVGKQSDYSFPSGHTSASMAVSVVMLALLPRKYGVPAFVIGVLVSLSRLYVGVHYPTDVLCAAVIAVCVAICCIRFYKKKYDGEH
ncbi:MAG: phosphatase PAP2 family protein [Ruminococcus sp.]|nr:phosphatase PAP2 family protein [Ruminococcus sp.]